MLSGYNFDNNDREETIQFAFRCSFVVVCIYIIETKDAFRIMRPYDHNTFLFFFLPPRVLVLCDHMIITNCYFFSSSSRIGIMWPFDHNTFLFFFLPPRVLVLCDHMIITNCYFYFSSSSSMALCDHLIITNCYFFFFLLEYWYSCLFPIRNWYQWKGVVEENIPNMMR